MKTKMVRSGFVNKEGKREQSKYGFTMVELSLSIAFLSILSITIVLIITNAISAYHRGLTLNDINSTGMDLIDDFRGTIQNSPRRSVIDLCNENYTEEKEKEACKSDNAEKMISVVRYGKVFVGSKQELNDVPVFGAFCTGRYSYIWNSGYYFSPDARVTAANDSELEAASFSGYESSFRLLKVLDKGRELCIGAVKKVEQNYPSDNVSIDPSFAIETESEEYLADPPVDLLEAKNNLAIYDLIVPAPADNGKGTLFYSMSFILGTVKGGINVMASGDYCATPGGFDPAVENFDYCAINKFNFAVQATGG